MKLSSGKVERIEKASLSGERWRDIGCNARKGWHGKVVPNDIVRITIDGVTGFGWSKISKEEAEKLIGISVESMVLSNGRVCPEYRNIDIRYWIGMVKFIKCRFMHCWLIMHK